MLLFGVRLDGTDSQCHELYSDMLRFSAHLLTSEFNIWFSGSAWDLDTCLKMLGRLYFFFLYSREVKALTFIKSMSLLNGHVATCDRMSFIHDGKCIPTVGH